MIHPTAIVDPEARIDPTARIGPYAVIESGVVIGPGCELGPHTFITGRTVIGAQNRFCAGCVIGEAPQDLKYQGQPTRLEIGDRNVFREHVTVHRSATEEGVTRIGSDNFLMASSHVGHNSVVGNRVILANGVLLGGHVLVEDRAFLSGNCMVHQFTRIGGLALMQGGAGLSKDLPPYTVARAGINRLSGLNTVGLRRAGISSVDRLMLRRLYQALFRSGKPFRAAFEAAVKEFPEPLAVALLDFVRASRRGVCAERGGRAAGQQDEEL